jgi:16S rRNA (cytosine967-C5)-methyltransferase
VRPGGRLVYATCTLNRAENEDVARALEQARSGFARVRPLAGQLGESFFRGGFFTCLPHLHGTDGFFAAAWQRAG